MISCISKLVQHIHRPITFLLQICLWGNRFDLSLNIGKSKNIIEDPLKAIVSLDQYILADHSDKIWNTLNVSNNKNHKTIGE